MVVVAEPHGHQQNSGSSLLNAPKKARLGVFFSEDGSLKMRLHDKNGVLQQPRWYEEHDEFSYYWLVGSL